MLPSAFVLCPGMSRLIISFAGRSRERKEEVDEVFMEWSIENILR